MSLSFLPIFLISMLLFFVLFFGIGFILNMLLRMSWIMAIIYPIIALAIIQEVSFLDYFTSPSNAFSSLGESITTLAPLDIAILLSGLAGAVLSGVIIKLLRKKGYRMF